MSLVLEKLEESGRVSPEAIAGAQGISPAQKLAYMIDSGVLDESEFAAWLSAEFKVPVFEHDLAPASEVLHLVPVELMKKFVLVPLRANDRSILVATLDPSDPEAVAELKEATGRQVEIVILPFSMIRNLITNSIITRRRDFDVIGQAVKQVESIWHGMNLAEYTPLAPNELAGKPPTDPHLAVVGLMNLLFVELHHHDSVEILQLSGHTVIKDDKEIRARGSRGLATALARQLTGMVQSSSQGLGLVTVELGKSVTMRLEVHLIGDDEAQHILIRHQNREQ